MNFESLSKKNRNFFAKSKKKSQLLYCFSESKLKNADILKYSFPEINNHHIFPRKIYHGGDTGEIFQWRNKNTGGCKVPATRRIIVTGIRCTTCCSFGITFFLLAECEKRKRKKKEKKREKRRRALQTHDNKYV